MHITDPTEPKKQKAFSLAPPEEDVSQQIINARKTVLRDQTLSDGAKVLFCFLIDLAVSRTTMYAFGAVLISTTKLCENLNRCHRAIWKWKRQLVSKRYLWITKQPMPNFWPVDVFHITALVQPGDLQQLATRDGLWGNGARRTLPTNVGLGARGPVRRTECHRTLTASNPSISSIVPENATESGTELHQTTAQNMADRRTKCGGEPQPIRRGAVKSAAGSRTKGHLPAARNVSGAPHKQSLLIKPKKVDVLSESEIKGLKAGPPQVLDDSFNNWVRSLEGSFPSRLDKMRDRFTEQLKKATADGKATLKRKIAHLDVLLDGPQPEWQKSAPKPVRALPTTTAPAPVTDEQLLQSARNLVDLGMADKLMPHQREALRKAGEL
jgi:hypothetical protein